MGTVAGTLVPGAKLTLGLSERLLKDITPEKFARKPEGVDTNHPAWVYGHLSTYPDRVLELVGRGDLARPDAEFSRLFANKTPSTDDPKGEIFPPMEAIVARYMERTNAALSAIAETKDEQFAAANESMMPDMFPTVGAAVAFLMQAHPMMHLGQVSAWRRCMGLGSAM